MACRLILSTHEKACLVYGRQLWKFYVVFPSPTNPRETATPATVNKAFSPVPTMLPEPDISHLIPLP